MYYRDFEQNEKHLEMSRVGSRLLACYEMVTWYPILGDSTEEGKYYFQYNYHPCGEHIVEAYAVSFQRFEFPSGHPDHNVLMYVLQKDLQSAFPYGCDQVEVEAHQYASQHRLQFQYVSYGHANYKLHRVDTADSNPAAEASTQ